MTKKQSTKKMAPKKNAKTSSATKVKSVKKLSHFLQYKPALESTSVVQIKDQYQLFIDGSFVTPHSKDYFASINPASNKTLCQVARADKTDVDRAVAAAKKAFSSWSQLSGMERGKYLFRIARILQERAREFAVLETLDGGKPIKETRDVDVPLAAQHFFYYAGWADKLAYAFPGKQMKPVGVCAQIIPWNFPLLMAAWKIAPALACGNTVVLKPAEQTPLTALLLAEVLIEAELPPGVVNILTGAGETGALLVQHPDVQKIAFTGSTDIGKSIARTIAGTDKKLTLELGGKSAHIIFEDAAIDQAVEGIIQGIFFNQGHVCCAGSRLLVEETIYDQVVAKLKRRMATLKVGDPLDKNTDVGAINNVDQFKKIQGLVQQGLDEGGEIFQSSCPLPSQGLFLAPAFFTNVSSANTIVKTEIFGPILTIQTFRTPEEAIAKANDTPYGLAAGIWSEKGSKVHYVAGQLKAGVIWANTYNKFDAASPFGGFKESGQGREGGMHGLYPYLCRKEEV